MPTTRLTKNLLSVAICVVLAVVTTALYWPVTHHQFINFDDDFYITGNSHVNAGLTRAGVVWAFQTGFTAYWHPLTWISHMLDCQLYGLSPGGHHLTNLLFHVANSLLLFLLLNQLTGTRWRSALVAALFAWHPLHVESVAWASERKDVLSAFFWLLTLMAYARYAQKRSKVEGRGSSADVVVQSPDSRHSTLDYLLALSLFACGLMSKPMVVTLPFVLLLIDFWPLNRFKNSARTAAFLIVEKIPFFVLAVASSVVTYRNQASNSTVWSSAELSLSSRVANALWSYVRYISKTFWPADLSIFYPYPQHWPVGPVIVAALLLAVWSGLIIWSAKRKPYLFVGWFLFLGTLVPTIGLVQVGAQSIADRYMYIPSIGLFILIVWGLNDFLDWRPRWRRIAAFFVGVALAGCLVDTRIQLANWQNSIKLFQHAIAVTTDNFIAYNCLGQALYDLGAKDEASVLWAEAVQIAPKSSVAQYNLGMSLAQKGKLDEALEHLAAAAKLAPDNADIRYGLGVFLLQHGKPEEAAGHFAAAIDGRPDFAEAHRRLAQALSELHKSKEAIFHYQEALRLKPDFADALNELAWILSTNPESGLRSGVKALQLARRACELTRNQQPVYLITLSAAWAETGQFADAIASAQRAGILAQTAGQRGIAAKAQELLKFYQSDQPFRETF